MALSKATAEYLPPIRKFETGATRSPDSERDDPEGCLSPLVIDRFNQYMTKHRIQIDGSVRASDNWQKGMPLASYMKGMWRHFLHLWQRHRNWPVTDPNAGTDIEEDLCALFFNVQGYLHEVLKEKLATDAIRREATERNHTLRELYREARPSAWSALSQDCH